MVKGIFELLDNGIYRAYWRSHSAEEIQAYAEWLTEANSKLPVDSTMRILHNYREVGTPPFNRIKETINKFNLRPDVVLRIAHISDDISHQLILQNVTLVAGMNANRKFFKSSEEAKAIAWLLED